METPFDWVTVLVFAGLAVLFLHRSTAAEPGRDKIWMYAPPALALAFANWIGNEAMKAGNTAEAWLAGFIVAATVVYIFHILKPFAKNP
jgi:hypothetical protein